MKALCLSCLTIRKLAKGNFKVLMIDIEVSGLWEIMITGSEILFGLFFLVV